jgi:hypothetical protein
MDQSNNLICQTSTGQQDDWKNLYETAFPQDERMTVEEIRQLLSKGQMQLHVTTNKNGELLCFSLSFLPGSDFVLLSYIATDATRRSGGFGSKHLKRLVEVLKAQYPNYLGLFLEIESTKEAGLDAEIQKARLRRLAFYQRLGAKRLCKNYPMPPLAPGAKPRAGELLWIEFGASVVIDDTVLKRVVTELYAKAYNLPETDPLAQQVLAQFDPSKPGASVCPVTPPPASGSGSAPAPGDTTSATAQPAQPASAPIPATVTPNKVESTPVVPPPQPDVPAKV